MSETIHDWMAQQAVLRAVTDALRNTDQRRPDIKTSVLHVVLPTDLTKVLREQTFIDAMRRNRR